MTTSGKLNPGLAGANIVVRYTPPPARGSWSSDVTTDVTQLERLHRAER